MRRRTSRAVDHDFDVWEFHLRLRPGTRQALWDWISRWLDAKDEIEAESQALYYESQASFQPTFRELAHSKLPDLNFRQSNPLAAFSASLHERDLTDGETR